ncbi:MAG TPA: (2Fe-2S)-binding protein [Chloroflexota bacterium]|jgi:bacterioferritin-associated ferredoxin
MYLCLCKGVTEADVVRVARAGITTAEGLIVALGLRDPECCGRCAEEIEEFVALALREGIVVDAHLLPPVRHSGEEAPHAGEASASRPGALVAPDLLREVPLEADLFDGF